MRKKFTIIFAAVTAVTMAASFLSACAGPAVPEHKHSIYTMEAKAATCTKEGNIKYDYCLYCGQCFIDGEEVEESEVILPVDHNNHSAKTEYTEVKSSCTKTGVKAYWYCDDCGTYSIDGKEMSAEKDGQDAIDAALTIAVDPAAHNLADIAQKDATCVVAGIKAHKECSDCGAWFTTDGTALPDKGQSESLAIAPSGAHEWEGDFCKKGDAYKQYYDKNDASKYVVIDGLNGYDFTAASVGATHSTTASNRSAAVKAILEDRMTFSMQKGSNASVTATGDTWQVTQSSGTVGSFTRFAIDDGAGNPYKGKFVLTFDVSVDRDTTISRLGIKVVREYYKTAGDSSTEAVDPVDNGEWSKLIGTNTAEENNPDRKLTPGETYRFKYVGETTDENQMIQLFTHFGPGVITFSNLHYVPLKDEKPEGIVSAKLLSFAEASSKVDVPLPEAEVYTVNVAGGTIKGGTATEGQYKKGDKITLVAEQKQGYKFVGWYNGETLLSQNAEFEYTVEGAATLVAKFEKEAQTETVYEATTSKTAVNIKGDKFFDAAKWSANGEKNVEVKDGNLVFTADSTARFDLFHVAQDSGNNWVHLGDNGTKTDAVKDIYGKAYTYTFDISATGAFDLQVLGNSTAKKCENNQYSAWLSFAADGTLTLNFGHYNGDENACWGELSYKTDFKFGAEQSNKVSVKLVRVDNDVLKLGVVVNGKTVEFGGKITNTGNYAFADGYLTVTGIFGSVGYGQRVGFYPAESSTVTVSGMGIGIDGVNQTVTEPEPEPETIYEASTSNSAQTIHGKDFFDTANWKDGDSAVPELKDGNLVFTADTTAARTDLFQVAKNSSDTWVHLGDKAEKGDTVKDIYGKSYTFTFELSATGAFDLQILAASGAKKPSSGANNMWLNIAEGGKVTFNIGCGYSAMQSVGEITGISGFAFGADKKNTVSLTLIRQDTTLKIALSVNGKEVVFTADSIANSGNISVENGIINFNKVTGKIDVGYGGKVGFFPATDSTVTVSGMGIGIDGKDYAAE